MSKKRLKNNNVYIGNALIVDKNFSQKFRVKSIVLWEEDPVNKNMEVLAYLRKPKRVDQRKFQELMDRVNFYLDD